MTPRTRPEADRGVLGINSAFQAAGSTLAA